MDPTMQRAHERDLLLIDPNELENNIQDPTNNWTTDSYNTVNSWKTSLIKSYFIYQFLVDKYKTKWNRMLILVLLFSTAATLLAAANTAIQKVSDDFFKNQTLIFNIILVVVNAIVLISNGIIKIYKFDNIVAEYTAYIEKVDQLCLIIHTQLMLPVHMREDASKFILKQNVDYTNIIKQSPTISTSDYNTAIKKYKNFISNDRDTSELTRKYKIRTKLIDV